MARGERQDIGSTRAVAAVCRRLLAADMTRLERPGGSRRHSVRAHLDDRSVIVTKRSNTARARLEQAVLRSLEPYGVPVPRILAADAGWLIQEDLGDRRLSYVLEGATAEVGERWLGAGLASLAAIHRAAAAAGLDRQVARIGAKADWLRRLLDMPSRLGAHLALPAPELAERPLLEALGVRQPRFVKWDARPGNAVARDDGTVAWFDWEHCGARNRLDDVAWLMADEYAPDLAPAEDGLLASYLEQLGEPESLPAARAYLFTFGTFHMCVRLGLILKYRGDGDWWDRDYCLDRDKVGVTRDAALRVCTRASRWAAASAQTAPLAPWLHQLRARIDDAP